MTGYLIALNIISVLATLYDKAAAQSRGRRIPERVLMGLGVIGGALGMFVTMLLVRHKTRHMLFMVGLPVLAIIHIIIWCIATF